MTIMITAEESDYMTSFVKDVIEKFGPRMPCSQAEADAAEYIKQEMETTCNEISIEPFTCSPGGLLGWIKFDIMFIVASFILYLFTPFITREMVIQTIFYAICACLGIVSWVIAWEEFFSYNEFIDGLLKKEPSENVIGRILPEGGNVEHIIAFSGHHDSAKEFNLLRYLRAPGYGIVIFAGVGIMALWTFLAILAFIFSLAGIVQGLIYETSSCLLVIGIPVLVLLWCFTWWGERANKVPGAVDNLSAVAVVLAIGRYVKQHPEIVPENTEIRLISFGCEEAGLRGAYRYAARHKEELLAIDSQNVNMDGIQSAKTVMIYAFEPTTRTAHSPEVTQKIYDAAIGEDLKAFKFGDRKADRIAGFITGGTDATALSKAKIKAGSFGSIDFKNYFSHYHTRRDTPDKIEAGALESALRICIKYIENEKK
ncbi:MAG TPA: M28 family peptidase [Candidatus Lokiarchaeia archaeon]|nr:M28 family peptidase [Candidatus Lokiarchaeia archaeon]